MPERTAPANRLIHETSPYLLQHAHNPVDWRPWGEEAFAEARRRDVPIMLSSGYSACHWCHRMERESFADPETARLINEGFVPVKVDREERPDIDQVYQTAAQALAGQSGWPLTVFLTPGGEPFFGGTYFPPEPSYGRPAFREVLRAVARAWREKPADVRAAAREIAEAVATNGSRPREDRGGIPSGTLVAEAVERLVHSIDRRHGGFGRAPKFPSVPALMLMLRHGRRSGNDEAVDLALLSLRRMSRGGIHDQLGGGFHRYSTDERWLVPHFEKMLYDNAQLLAAYAAAYQITRDAEFAETARGIVEYTAREMVSPAGGFFSTQDADSEGVEGKYFLWSLDEVHEVLAEERLYRTAKAFYGLTEAGNFEGRNILRRAAEIGAIAAEQGRPEAEVAADLERARRGLLAARAGRIRPFRDEKVILGWNGLMISGLAKAAQVLGERTALAMAARAAGFIQAEMADGPGRLRRVWKDGRAKIPAFLEDYAFFIAGLIDLYETDFEPAHLRAALQYQETVLAEFREAGGRYVESGARGERLFAPAVSGFDQAVPSGAAVHGQNLIRLHCLTGEDRFWREAADLLRAYAPEMAAYPLGYAALLTALEMLQHRPAVIAIAGPAEDSDLLRRFREVFLPYAVVAAQRREGEEDPSVHPAAAVLAGRPAIDGRTAFYVCSESACLPPAADWPGLRQALEVCLNASSGPEPGSVPSTGRTGPSSAR